jgi:DNA helicase II / ATP-dependent DNA helicase PcrA
MRTPTQEQQAVVDSPARVRIVRAAPGSGKTWLVAELIRKELDGWPDNGGGIAALSFTRVGGNEIRKALAYELGHPHFVGTIDAFLFRYVVRPFLQRAHPGHAAPRLIPADWNPGAWTTRPGGAPWAHRGAGGSQAQTYNLFEVCFIDEDVTGPVLARPRPYQGGIETVASTDRAGVLAAKRQAWRRLGWVTHADAAFLASELLADPTHGATIKAVLLRRFPLLIVDELQDTGFFLCKSIRLFLSDPSVRGVLVGDPRQAIYEFNGARPDLFATFDAVPGATLLPLARSQRCPASIAACATHLADPSGPFDPANGDAGRAFLVRYADMVADVKRLVRTIRLANPGANAKVIVRWNSTIGELTSGKGDQIRKLRCPALTHIAQAVQNFRHGNQIRALAGARAALELAVFGEEGVTDQELLNKRIDPHDWKALAVRCLLKADGLDSALSMQQWQTAAGIVIDGTLQAFGLPTGVQFVAGRLKPQNLTGRNRTKAKADTAFAEFAPRGVANANADDNLFAETVHAVKGETHDVTVLVCPDSSRAADCPSAVWWSTDAVDREERRIAYVAMTRSRSDLVLCVSDVCYQRLCRDRATFVATFQCKTVDECIAAYAPAGTPIYPAVSA